MSGIIGSRGSKSGIIRPPFIGFVATGSGTTLSVASGAILVLVATVYNVNSCYNTSDGKFTPPVNGYYHFDFIYYSYHASNDVVFEWKIWDGTTSFGRSRKNATDNGDMFGFGIDIYLTAGQDTWIKNDSGGARTIYQDNMNTTRWNGHLIQ